MTCDGQNVVLTSVLGLGLSRPVDARPLPPALIVSVAWIKGPIVFGIEVDPSDSFAAFSPLMQWTAPIQRHRNGRGRGRVTPLPPHRSRRALLTHRAPVEGRT